MSLQIKKRKNGRLVALFTVFCVSSSMLCGCHRILENPSLPEQYSQTEANVIITAAEFETITESQQTVNTLQPENPVFTETASDATTAETDSSISETSAPEDTKKKSKKSKTTADTTTAETTVVQTTAETTISTPTAATTVKTVEQTTETTTEAATQIAAESMYFGSNSYNTLNFNEQKGFWITYLEFASILKNKSSSQFRNSIGEYFDNIKSIGFNTVYVQVRAFGDAYYDSALFPATDNFNGTIGTSSKFDALEIMISEAHDRGLSIHAWINPMRLMTDTQMSALNDKYQIKKWYTNKKGDYVVKSGDRWYLNPAYSEVTDLIADGISEIVSNYKVDGIQIDDYFYPTTSSSFDYTAYNALGNGSGLSNWRIKNVNSMVKKLYSAAHKANSSIMFGISPQGSVDNNYNELYADAKKWCSESGYCDYILPQVYFGFDNAALPYKKTISQWSNMCTNKNVKLVIGLAAYKIGVTDTYAGSGAKNEWINNSDIMARQMSAAKELDRYGGVAIYRYESLFKPSSSVSSQVSKEISNIKKN